MDALIPEALHQVIISRPELDAYEPKLHWIKAQMEYAHSTAQAQYVSGAEKGLQELDAQDTATSPTSDATWLYSEIQRHAASGDWTAHGHASEALYAL